VTKFINVRFDFGHTVVLLKSDLGYFQTHLCLEFANKVLDFVSLSWRHELKFMNNIVSVFLSTALGGMNNHYKFHCTLLCNLGWT
jgi:hypothetical protein